MHQLNQQTSYCCFLRNIFKINTLWYCICKYKNYQLIQEIYLSKFNLIIHFLYNINGKWVENRKMLRRHKIISAEWRMYVFLFAWYCIAYLPVNHRLLLCRKCYVSRVYSAANRWSSVSDRRNMQYKYHSCKHALATVNSCFFVPFIWRYEYFKLHIRDTGLYVQIFARCDYWII